MYFKIEMTKENLLDVKQTLTNTLDFAKGIRDIDTETELKISIDTIDQIIDKKTEITDESMLDIQRFIKNAVEFSENHGADQNLIKGLNESLQIVKKSLYSGQSLFEEGTDRIPSNQPVAKHVTIDPTVLDSIEKRFAEFEKVLKSIEGSIQGSGKNELKMREEFEKILDQLKELVTKYVDQLKSSLEGKVDHIKTEANNLIASKMQIINDRFKDLSEAIDKNFPLRAAQEVSKEITKEQPLDKTRDKNISEKNTEHPPDEKKEKQVNNEKQPLSRMEKENEGLKTFLNVFKEKYPKEFNDVINSMNQAIQLGDKANDHPKKDSPHKKPVVEEKEVLEL